ncbi:MAG: ATP-dependent helicase [Candidatus Omnitrophota bacterium]
MKELSPQSKIKPENINEAQWQAVEFRGGHLLIVAGPGTGKTHTLTHRIARIARELTPFENILAITFTNRAAHEMKERLKQAMGQELKQIFVGTFHSFCLKLLRDHIEQTDLPREFCMASKEDIDKIGQQLWPDEKKRSRKDLLNEISSLKTKLLFTDVSEYALKFNRLLRSKNLLDFDDLLLESLRLLKDNKVVCEKIRQQYRHIFVDEYQDINALQHRLLALLVSGENFLTAIGDPNQAIYSFRGSDVRYFESFKEDFPGASILSLTQNYRSAPNLLEASGQVMSKARNSFIPDLTAKIYTEGHLTIYEAPTDKAEAEYVVHQVERLVGGTAMFSQDSKRVSYEHEARYSFGDIAVLYRLHAQKKYLQEAFARSGIPFSEHYEYFDDPQEFEDQYKEKSESISLLTLHAAKGCEFPVVFMVGCEKNLLPLAIEGFSSSEEEERRLFYVGMTRAKKRLYLARAKRRFIFGQHYENQASAFLSDIEEKLKAYEKGQSQKGPSKKQREKQQLKLFK